MVYFHKQMSNKSFIYRNIFVYRFIMNILYLGKYKRRFYAVIQQINNLPRNSSTLELCFGDVYIAQFCKQAGYRWRGLDVNNNFVKTAQRMGFDAYYGDLAKLEVFPHADVCIMMGSLYHFHPHTDLMLAKMLSASDSIVISEPVSNLSSQTGLIGFLAKRAANAGKGHEPFRYNRQTFIAMIEKNSGVLGYDITAIQDHGKDIIVKLQKNEKQN